MRNNLFIFSFFFFSITVFSQFNNYKYKHKLEGINQKWHKINLPDTVFGSIQSDFSDIRIYGILNKKDTIEAPYILKIRTEKQIDKTIPFQQINRTKKELDYYISLQLSDNKKVNQIELDLDQPNYEGLVKLEGSNDQQEWFTILENYRIVSIKNEFTDYHFTRLVFNDAIYKYFRIKLSGNINPEFNEAIVSEQSNIEGKYRNYKIRKIQKWNDKTLHQTILIVDYNNIIPLSYLKIFIKSNNDYFRPITIQALLDSVKTEKGWIYNYKELSHSTLSSFEENEFRFKSSFVSRLKIIIDNYDNSPLQIDSINTKGYIHELNVRFDKNADYYLCYGNNQAYLPNYDISNFSFTIPDSLSELTIQNIECNITSTPINNGIKPIFENKYWLWVTMLIIIGVLAIFSFYMLKKVN